MLRKFTFVLFLVMCLNVNAKIITTIFGDIDEQSKIVHELISSPAMQRLKNIDQSGPEPYFTNNFPMFSRYDHTLGVYALLVKYKVSPQEQIAGLLHDSSHTVFSHLGDIIFQGGAQRDKSYQDNIHDWFLSQMGVDKIIQAYNLTLQDISPKNPKFTALEQDFPDMNADRIEYNLHTGLVFKDLDNNDVQAILNALRYENNKWYFTDIITAKKFAKLSTYYTTSFWGSSHNVALYTTVGAAIKYALKHNLITSNEIHFGVDQEIVTKLKDSKDPVIKQLVTIMSNIDDYYVNSNPQEYDVYQPIKMRGIDPLVMNEGKLERLSTLSIDFKHDLQNTKHYADRGVYIKFTNVRDKNILGILRAGNM